MSLAKLAQRTVTLRIELGGESVDVRCRPMSALQSARIIAAMDAASEDNSGIAQVLIDALTEVVLGDEDKAALPDLPLGVLSAMFGALTTGEATEGKYSITRG